MKPSRWTTLTGGALIVLASILLYRASHHLPFPWPPVSPPLAGSSPAPDPAFWRTTWFQWGLAALAIAGLYAYMYWTDRRHQAQKRQLEALVAERTRQLQQAKEAAQQAQRTAEAANQAKSAFLANMSHELRTPLNVILGFTQLMARNPEIPVEEQEHLTTIQRSGEYLLTLINQVLDLSKIEAKRVTLNEKAFDLHALLAEMEGMFSLKATRHHLQFLIERVDAVPRYIHADEVKLRQVLINLLTNAFKFTHEGGVALRARLANHALLHEEPPRRNGPYLMIQFEIEDSGPGIAPEDIDSLFEAFTQTSSGRQAAEGTGLGLPISQQFVRLMGGDIRVNSALDRGTVFTFDIAAGVCDADAMRDVAQARTVKRLEPGQPRFRILVVDDMPDNRQVLVELLGSLGFDVQEAATGQEALERWQQWRPHLIWMDLRMPDMDGYEAAQRIRLLEAATRAPTDSGSPSGSANSARTVIIALSASSFESEQTVALNHGCDEFLRKPFRNSEIFDMLHRHLGVTYVYEAPDEQPGPASGPGTCAAIDAEELRALPAAIWQDLRQAVDTIDVMATQEVIERIRGRNARLADALDDLARHYRFDTLQNACDELS